MRWVHLANLSDFEDRSVLGVTHEDRKLALYRLEDGVYATTDVCPHQSAGEVVEGFIECPGHYALFNIRTGQAAGGPTTSDLGTYPVKLDGSKILVLIDA